MDDEWIYGGRLAQIHQTLVEGTPEWDAGVGREDTGRAVVADFGLRTFDVVARDVGGRS